MKRRRSSPTAPLCDVIGCGRAGVDSFDGSSASRFAETLPALERARQQIDLEGYLARRAA
ncbi:hypothetical protein [Sphingomonas sp.]|uniref:hypothetical protein n=1 Tax=Sphingomonas sp. TaxID=28214 RepID=UPI0028AD628D|nr:hypothetical protein [Sphingomonas sp.]